MPKRQRPRWLFRAFPLAITLSVLLSGCGRQYVLFHPSGPVGTTEFHLLILATVAMLVVIIPVWVLFVITLIRFRDNPKHKGPYVPKWQGSRLLEIILLGIPLIIVTIIAVPTVQKTYALDRLPPKKDPIVINVTSLDWKWLFQYPGQGIATVNYVKIPAGTPVLFRLTADSPMNTFWVPKLGGMEYTMPGEVLPLWLSANKPGVYLGRSGQFSGPGFVHMHFQVDSVSKSAFAQWVNQVKHTAPAMTLADYHSLVRVGTTGPKTYSSYPSGIFPTKTHGFTLTGTTPMRMP